MTFFCKRVFHNLLRHLGVYLVFLLEFALGTAILSGTLSVVLSLRRDLRAEQQKLAEGTIGVVRYTQSAPRPDEQWTIPWTEQSDISYETYRDLETMYGDELKILFAYCAPGLFENVYQGTERTPETLADNIYCSIWYINEAFFEKLFGVPMEPGKIYAGEDAYDALTRYVDYQSNPQYIFDERPYPLSLTVEDGAFCLSGGTAYNLAAAPPSEKPYIEVSGVGIEDREYLPQLSNIVFLPLEEFPIYRDLLLREFGPYNQESEIQATYNEDGEETGYLSIGGTHLLFVPELQIEYRSADVGADTLPELLNYLMLQHPGVEFKVDSGLMDLQKKADSIDQTIQQLLVVSSFLLITVVLGTTGLFLIFLHRRKRQMAVSFACGATPARLFGEIFIEILAVTGGGAGAGLLALPSLMPIAAAIYPPVAFHPVCIPLMLLAALGSALLTAALAFIGVGEIAPAKILKNL